MSKFQSGQAILTIVDHFGGALISFTLSISQVIGLIFIYGLQNISWDAEFMSNRVNFFWKICWAIFTPIILIAVFIVNAISFENPTYGPLEFPLAYIVAGWTIFLVAVLQIPVWAIRETICSYQNTVETKGRFKTAIKNSLSPSEDWGPENMEIKNEWRRVKSEAFERKQLLTQEENHSWIREKIYVILGRYRLYS